MSSTAKAWLVIGGVLMALIVIGVIAGGGSPTPTTSTGETQDTTPATAAPDTSAAPEAPATTAAPVKPKLAGIGTPVRDGKFEFRVRGTRCSIRRVGDAFIGKSAQGQFCMVTVSVANIGTEPRTFDSSNQHLYDAAGRRFETSDAQYYLEESKAFLENINPGNAVVGKLLYDVPAGRIKLAKIDLHDSAFSGGVEVAL